MRLLCRYWGEEDDHVSVASRKITHYAKSDCVGASKGLFFGLLTLICGLICLILFFVLIDHHNTQVRKEKAVSTCGYEGNENVSKTLKTFLGNTFTPLLPFH